MLASSPSSEAQEGSSPFATSDSLGSDDLLNLSADSITQSQLFSSSVRWSACHERASGLTECCPGLWMREKSNQARNRDQHACQQFRFWDVQKYVRFCGCSGSLSCFEFLPRCASILPDLR